MTSEEYQRNLQIVKEVFPRESEERQGAKAGDAVYMEDLAGQLALVDYAVRPMMHPEYPGRNWLRDLFKRWLGI